MQEDKELLKNVAKKIQWAYQMIENLKDFEKIEGVDKLSRKIQKEIKFLEKVYSTKKVKKEHLLSTNLIHLSAIVKRLFSAQHPVYVLKPFKYEDAKLEVDIVCEGGNSWIKVIARNPKALTLISCGNAEYGQKSVIDQAASYKKCAQMNPHMYKPPKIIFHFACGIERPLASKLENVQGIVIEGDQLDAEDSQLFETSIEQSLQANLDSESEELADCISSNIENFNTDAKSSNINILNLDVSTLLAYVTNMTNGEANYVYLEPLLTMQAEWERSRPVKSVLDELFVNKELIVCQTAYDNFTNIMNLIGGPNENKRAQLLLQRLRIVEDIPEGRVMNLSIGGKVKSRSRLVFATGENLKSITVSANEGFVRAARMQGIECMVFIHEPRSLSEMKQLNAKKIDEL